ncbi:hypothetical protein F5B21DRAFT_204080 [Xylaria acuta]|nr:hypothetical protein F5B21DRAFT_204080 [Xylaria acuta]
MRLQSRCTCRAPKADLLDDVGCKWLVCRDRPVECEGHGSLCTVLVRAIRTRYYGTVADRRFSRTGLGLLGIIDFIVVIAIIIITVVVVKPGCSWALCHPAYSLKKVSRRPTQADARGESSNTCDESSRTSYRLCERLVHDKRHELGRFRRILQRRISSTRVHLYSNTVEPGNYSTFPGVGGRES